MFTIDQKFEGIYPPEAATWCNERGDCYITELDKGTAEDGESIRRFQIVAIAQPTLGEAKAAKLAAINAATDKTIAALTTTYPDREIATFNKQEAEARAYTANPTAPTPLLSALSQARGVPLDELARRVLVKADAFAVASGSIIGQRQALEDRLDACTTVEEIEALAVTIAMPGTEAGA